MAGKATTLESPPGNSLQGAANPRQAYPSPALPRGTHIVRIHGYSISFSWSTFMRYSSLGGMICRTTQVVVGTGGGTSCSSPQDEDDDLAECVGRKNWEEAKSEETGEEDLVVVLGR